MFDVKIKWPVIDLSKSIAHSGGALGADIAWENIGSRYGLHNVKHYSYQTKYHKSLSKVEISDLDFQEGIQKIKNANELILKRKGIDKYMNLLARNWAQIKYSQSVYAVGRILWKGDIGSKGKTHTGNNPIVDGGTGYAIAMSIIEKHPIWIFDQERNCWYFYNDYENDFKKLPEAPHITSNDFAAIGTRQIKQNGLDAIELTYSNTLQKYKLIENDKK